MARRQKLADLDVPEEVKESVWNMYGGEPFEVRRLVTLQNCRDWAANEITGPVCVRETGDAEVTFFLPSCDPEPLKFFKDVARDLTPVFVAMEFKTGIWRYWWNRLALFVWGR